MLVTDFQLILLEADNHKLGFGTVRLVSDLNTVRVELDLGNSRALLIFVHEKPLNPR